MARCYHIDLEKKQDSFNFSFPEQHRRLTLQLLVCGLQVHRKYFITNFVVASWVQLPFIVVLLRGCGLLATTSRLHSPSYLETKTLTRAKRKVFFEDENPPSPTFVSLARQNTFLIVPMAFIRIEPPNFQRFSNHFVTLYQLSYQRK